MRPTRFFLAVLLIATLADCGNALANFAGFDDFSAISANWAPDSTLGGGMFTVGGGALNFTTPSFSSNEQANRRWSASVGDYGADWSLRMDVAVGAVAMTAGQYASVSMTVENQADGTDVARLAMRRDGAAFRNFYADNFVSGLGAETVFAPTTSLSASLGLSYNASTHVITAGYDDNGAVGGYRFAPIQAIEVDATGRSWQMGPASAFVARLYVQSEMPIALGQITIDNFTASPLQLPFASPGDYDADGDVDGADFLAWQRATGSHDAAADGNRDGAVNGQDLLVWEGFFGAAASGAAAAAPTAVPEPASAVLAILATLVLMSRGGHVWGLSLSLAVLLCGITTLPVQASQIAYSWSGTIGKNPGSLEDPWSIGLIEKPFSISVFVGQASSELQFTRLEVDNAAYRPSAIVVAIDGVPTSRVVIDDSTNLLFSNDQAGTPFTDAIGISFEAEFNGVVSHLYTAVYSVRSTFTFLLENEAPPIFGAAETGPLFAYGGPYVAVIVGGTLVKTPVSLAPGDYDRDLDVDGADFLLWQRTVGSTTNFAADGDLDGAVTGVDLAVWKAFHGTAAGGIAVAPTAVPEPTTIALAAGFAFNVVCRSGFSGLKRR